MPLRSSCSSEPAVASSGNLAIGAELPRRLLGRASVALATIPHALRTGISNGVAPHSDRDVLLAAAVYDRPANKAEASPRRANIYSANESDRNRGNAVSEAKRKQKNSRVEIIHSSPNYRSASNNRRRTKLRTSDTPVKMLPMSRLSAIETVRPKIGKTVGWVTTATR